jgi:hypothetical protein
MLLNVHVLVLLMLFILEDLCLPRDFECTCISGLVLAILEDLCLPRDFKCTSPQVHVHLKAWSKHRSSRIENTNTTSTYTFKITG